MITKIHYKSRVTLNILGWVIFHMLILGSKDRAQWTSSNNIYIFISIHSSFQDMSDNVTDFPLY